MEKTYAQNVQVELSEPPKGMTLQKATVESDEIVLVLKADEKVVQAGYKDNLIVEAFTNMETMRQANKAAQKQRVSLGVLPAIPFEVVQQ